MSELIRGVNIGNYFSNSPLEDDIKSFAHWSVDKEKVVEVSEMIAKWAKNVLKIPEDVPVEKIPSIIAGMEKEKYEKGLSS